MTAAHRDAVATARDRAMARIMTRMDDVGAVRGLCDSRVLESALVLTLLRRANLRPEVRNGIVDCLRARRHAATGLDDLVIRTVLAEDDDRNHDPLTWLRDYDHFSASRKQLMFRTILAVLGAVDHDERLDPRRIEYTGFASWVNLILCSLKVLHAYGTAREDRVTEADRAFLVDQLALGGDRVWECHLTAHVLALLAVQRFQPGSALVRTGVDRLLGSRNDDGGFPFISGMEIFCTVTAGMALVSSGDPVLDRMADYLVSWQQPDGGWAYAEGVRQTDTDDTAYCLQFLRQVAPVRHATAIRAAETYYAGIANDTGGFPTFLKGHDSEVAMSAGALLALAPAWERYASICEATTEYLLDAQQPDGTFETSWSLCETNAVFRVLWAFAALPKSLDSDLRDRVAHAVSRSISYLKVAQNDDGGWGQRAGDPSDVISTSYALLAVPSNAEGVRYLLSQQRADGGFTSIPDQAGPRPLPLDVPVLAEISGLWALRHVVSQTDEEE